MGLLAPFFLLGLAALAIPVLVHLIQREKKQVVAFPSLMFVRKIPYQSVQRRRIRHWLLLALRLAALALIVAAFARPFVRGAAPLAAAGAKDVIILLDRSYSMGLGDRWGQAQTAARDALAQLAAGDRASLVLFATGAEVAVESTDDLARVREAIDRATPGPEATRYVPALELAATTLASSTRAARGIVLVSDFQKNGWAAPEGLALPPGTTLTPVTVGTAAAVPNLSVLPVGVARARFENQERATLTAGVVNRGDTPAENVAVSLEFEGRAVETARVTVAPGASASVAFQPVTLNRPEARTVVRLAADGLAADNAYHLVLSPSRPLPIVYVATGRGGSDTYVQRALAIGTSPRFAVTAVAADGLTDASLQDARVAVVEDSTLASAGVAALVRFAERGGGVLLVAGPRASWPADPNLPAALGDMVDRARDGGGRLSGLEYGHAVFAPFRAPRSGDFSGVRVYGYRKLTPAQGAAVLARFDDGAPALVERRVGRGRVALWGTSLDMAWNDLPVTPLFLPFVHQLVRTLAADQERPAAMTVGQVTAPDLGRGAGGLVAITPSGKPLPLDGEEGGALALGEPGFYEVRPQGQADGPSTLVAVNVDLAESDVTAFDPAEMVAAVGAGDGAAAAAAAAAVLPDTAEEQRQRVWWYLLFAGMLLLVGETWLAGRASRAAPGSGSGGA
jgi:hypothetical protein